MHFDRESFFKRHNIKMTVNRAIIMEIIAQSNDHPTAEEIYERALRVEPKIGIATIYRALALFEEQGAVKKLALDGEKCRYEIAYSAAAHYHLIDVKNDKIMEFELPDVEIIKKLIGERFGYKIIGCRFDLYGEKIDDK